MTRRTWWLLAAAVAGTTGLNLLSARDLSRPGLAPPSPPAQRVQPPALAIATDCIAPACQDTPLPPSPHVRPLTPAQWENTVRDLLRLPAVPGLSANFPPNPVPSGAAFGRDAGALGVASPALWAGYRSAAEVLARRVAQDPALLAKLLPAAAKSGALDDRIRAFVASFLPRAYRRPVTDSEVADMVALGNQVAAVADPREDADADPFLIRVRWIVATTLQSPFFLYRIEGGLGGPATAYHRTTAGPEERVRLNDYELAAKLSYALWGTMPDDRLTAYAATKRLATAGGVAAVAHEMLADPRAAPVLMDFHEQLFSVDLFAHIDRQTSNFPHFYPDLGRDAQEDVRRTIESLIISNPGTLEDLYSSDVAFVNAKLATIYGLEPKRVPALATEPESFVQVRMPNQRAGIVMHVGWLAMEAHDRDPSPIQRGVFMARRLLCLELGNPPPGALTTKIEGPPGSTNRARVEATTQALSGCRTCHGQVINPMGFAFEAFDAVGAFRTHDGASAIDSAGSTKLLGRFDNATAMLAAAKHTAHAHACYAAHWAAYLNEVPTVNATAQWLSPVIEHSMRGASVREIIAALVQTDAFLTVSRSPAVEQAWE